MKTVVNLSNDTLATCCTTEQKQTGNKKEIFALFLSVWRVGHM